MFGTGLFILLVAAVIAYLLTKVPWEWMFVPILIVLGAGAIWGGGYIFDWMMAVIPYAGWFGEFLIGLVLFIAVVVAGFYLGVWSYSGSYSANAWIEGLQFSWDYITTMLMAAYAGHYLSNLWPALPQGWVIALMVVVFIVVVIFHALAAMGASPEPLE